MPGREKATGIRGGGDHANREHIPTVTDGNQQPSTEVAEPTASAADSQPSVLATAAFDDTPTLHAQAPVTVTADGPGSPAQFRLGNRPPLTGIRAFLVGAVLIYHSNFQAFPGQWAAIQMFFVLSGFLITVILDREGKRNGRISLKSFYSRRAARLYPPLLLVVAGLAIYVTFVHVVNASQRVWGDSAAALFYYADYRQAFGHAPFFGFLAQTWSLSIEEQFYIIWSVLMVVAVAIHRRRLAYLFATVGLVLSVADRLYLLLRAPHFTGAVFARTYYAFDSRADAILLGCLLGLLASDGFLNNWRRWARRALTVGATVSAAALVWILLYAPLDREGLLVWQLPACTLGCAVIIVYLVICPTGLGSKFVGLGVFVFLGELSYTLYVVHFPVYLALQPDGTHWGFWPTQAARMAIMFAIAIASWFLMEKPLMAWRQRSAAR
jgi:peptidoglycan/LPS O-acetylase OafA/YrhL